EGLGSEDSDYVAFAGKALVECGTVALPYLRPLLDDIRPAWVRGSEEATISEFHHYRRADFAYHYACLILGTAPRFDPDPRKRDPEIARLKTILGGRWEIWSVGTWEEVGKREPLFLDLRPEESPERRIWHGEGRW